MYKILFVCTGNTCRSPMAEYIAKHLVKKRGLCAEISSAGLYASENKPMSANSEKALKTLGVEYNGEHLSRQFTGDMARDNDLVLTVTDDHKACIPIFLENLFSLREFVGVEDVGDPYGSSEEVYVESAKALYTAVEKIIDKIVSAGVLK